MLYVGGQTNKKLRKLGIQTVGELAEPAEKGSSAEKEQGIRHEQMHMKSAFDDGSQRINPEAEICVSTDDIDTGKITVVGIFKHGTPP